MTEESKHLTTTEKVQQKRKPGRPKGRRNRVDVNKSLQQARDTGMSLAEYKEVIDHYIDYAGEYNLTPKNVLDYLKEGVNVYKWITEELSKEGSGVGTPKAKDIPARNEIKPNVVKFQSTAK